MTSNHASITVNFSLSEPSVDFTASDISVNGGVISGRRFGYQLQCILAKVPQIFQCHANRFQNSLSTQNAASNTFNWTYDSTSPSVVISSRQSPAVPVRTILRLVSTCLSRLLTSPALILLSGGISRTLQEVAPVIARPLRLPAMPATLSRWQAAPSPIQAVMQIWHLPISCGHITIRHLMTVLSVRQ